MITYIFNKATGILETKFEGDISINDITAYILSLRGDKTLPKKLKIFTDASNGKRTDDVVPNDLAILIEENSKSLAERDFIFDAFVVSSSLEMALSMLYQELIKAKNYKFGIFSTKEAALNWLMKF